MIHALSWEQNCYPNNLSSPEETDLVLEKYYQEAISFLRWLTGGNVFRVFCYIRKNDPKLIEELVKIGYSYGFHSEDDSNLAVCKDRYWSFPDKEIPEEGLFIFPGIEFFQTIPETIHPLSEKQLRRN